MQHKSITEISKLGSTIEQAIIKIIEFMDVKTKDINFWFFASKQLIANYNCPIELKDIILLFLLSSFDYELKNIANIIYNKGCKLESLGLYKRCFFWYNDPVICFKITYIGNIIIRELCPYKLPYEKFEEQKSYLHIYNLLINKDIKSKEEICILGIMYKCGLGIIEDHKKSFELYCEAAKLGCSYAILNLGHTLKDANHKYVEQNLILSRCFYVQAVLLNDKFKAILITFNANHNVPIMNWNLEQCIENIEFK